MIIKLYELRKVYSQGERVLGVYSDISSLKIAFLHECQENNYFSNQGFIYCITHNTTTNETSICYQQPINYIMNFDHMAGLQLQFTGQKNTGEFETVVFDLCFSADPEEILNTYHTELETVSDRVYDLVSGDWLAIQSYNFFVTLSAENYEDPYQPTVLIPDPRVETIWV